MINPNDLEKLEQIFRKNGWDNYLCKLYEWAAKGKDIKKLIIFLEEEKQISEPIDSKRMPNTVLPQKIKTKYGNYELNNEELIEGKVFLGIPEGTEVEYDCPKGYEGKLEGKFVSCNLDKKTEEIRKKENDGK